MALWWDAVLDLRDAVIGWWRWGQCWLGWHVFDVDEFARSPVPRGRCRRCGVIQVLDRDDWY